MKRMKLVALVAVMLMLLSACNAVNVTEVAAVGDTVMQKPEFMYYLQSGKSMAMQEAQNQGLTLATDEDWNTVMIEDKTAAQYAKDKALESVKTIMVLEAKGKEAGYELTDADREQIASQKEQLIEQLGGRYSYEQALEEMGISVEALDSIVERSVYANAYMTKYSEENKALEPTEEEIQAKYNEDYVYVRHILISNQPPVEETPENVEILDEEGPLTEEVPVEEAPVEEVPVEEVPVEESPVEEAPAEEPAEEEVVDYDAQAKAEAEAILAELAAGGDFIALMNEHSDDGRNEDGTLSSDGYVMTDNGQMVPEFEEAAMKLEIGAYTTELVATDYGYHILMRYELPTEGTQYDTAISTVTSELTSEKLENQVNAWAEEVGFILNQKYFDKLKIKMEG